MHFLKSRRFAVVSAVIAMLVVAAVAYAYWSATGSGTGSALTDNPGAQTVSVDQTTAPTGLYPGSTINLSGTLTNSSTNPVHVNSISGTVTSVDTTHANAGCSSSDYSVGGTSSIGGSGSVAGSGGTQTWSGLTLTMSNTGVSQDACKGATVNISYTVS